MGAVQPRGGRLDPRRPGQRAVHSVHHQRQAEPGEGGGKVALDRRQKGHQRQPGARSGEEVDGKAGSPVAGRFGARRRGSVGHDARKHGAARRPTGDAVPPALASGDGKQSPDPRRRRRTCRARHRVGVGAWRLARSDRRTPATRAGAADRGVARRFAAVSGRAGVRCGAGCRRQPLGADGDRRRHALFVPATAGSLRRRRGRVARVRTERREPPAHGAALGRLRRGGGHRADRGRAPRPLPSPKRRRRRR